MKAERTKQHILQTAKKVFIDNGYSHVTMSDIIVASGLSRGGVYRYFHSTKEIFIEVITTDRLQNHEQTTLSFNDFLISQKKELLHIRKSLRVAGYEFMMQETSEEEKSLANDLYNAGVCSITKVLPCHTTKEDAQEVFLILEGLTVMALTGILTEAHIDTQIHRLLQRFGEKENK